MKKGLGESAKQKRLAKQVKGMPLAVAEFALEERDQLLARVAELEASVVCLTELQTAVQMENDRLKSQPSGVAVAGMAAALRHVIKELDAEACEDIDYAQVSGALGAHELFGQSLNALQVSAGESGKGSYRDDPRSHAELSAAGCRCVRFGEGNPHWPCKLHTTVSAGEIPFAGFDPNFCPGSNPENPQYPDEHEVSAGGVDERAAFTKDWLSGRVYQLARDGHIQFEDYYANMAWAGWQARAALTAGRAAVPEERLAFILDKHRKVVVERLPSRGDEDRIEVYVEEGFMGDKRYPAAKFSGDWSSDPSVQLETKRHAIDLAIAAAPSAQQQGGE